MIKKQTVTFPQRDYLLWTEEHRNLALECLKDLRQEIKQGSLPALSVVQSSAEKQTALEAAKKLEKFEKIHFYGTGGSSLGGQALCALKPGKSCFYDNVDSHTLSQALSSSDPSKTGVVFISKSGNTLETLAQAYGVVEHFRNSLGASRLPFHGMVLTEEKQSPLKHLADFYGLPVYPLSSAIGGRFSVFSLVGLLPGVINQLAIEDFLKGAEETLTHFLQEDFPLSLEGALVHYLLMVKENITQTIILPYSDRLFLFAQWAQQLIGESLGKEGKGFTPIAARGTVDQHSQLQLYLEGPKDKLFTFITVNERGRGLPIRSAGIMPELAFLQGKTIGDIMTEEHQATIASLHHHGCPTRELQLDKVDEASLGALMMHYMLEVILLAKMMKINPFDQPAVEHGKRITWQGLKAQ